MICDIPIGDLPFELKDLLIPANACLLGDSESFLFGRKQYNTCAMLYQSRGQTEKALNVWAKMGSGEFKEANAYDYTHMIYIYDCIIIIASLLAIVII